MRMYRGPYGEGKGEGEVLMYWMRAVIIGPKERQGRILEPFPAALLIFHYCLQEVRFSSQFNGFRFTILAYRN